MAIRCLRTTSSASSARKPAENQPAARGDYFSQMGGDSNKTSKCRSEYSPWQIEMATNRNSRQTDENRTTTLRPFQAAGARVSTPSTRIYRLLAGALACSAPIYCEDTRAGAGSRIDRGACLPTIAWKSRRSAAGGGGMVPGAEACAGCTTIRRAPDSCSRYPGGTISSLRQLETGPKRFSVHNVDPAVADLRALPSYASARIPPAPNESLRRATDRLRNCIEYAFERDCFCPPRARGTSFRRTAHRGRPCDEDPAALSSAICA